MADFTLSSAAFENDQEIPRRHSCEGDDLSPPLSWSGIPQGTRALALIVEDPDAPGGSFTHWLASAIEPESDGLEEAEVAPVEGRNDFGTIGYRGPCPPAGHGPHRYVFRLHAVDTGLELERGAGKQDLERALEGHVLGTAELIGRYER